MPKYVARSFAEKPLPEVQVHTKIVFVGASLYTTFCLAAKLEPPAAQKSVPALLHAEVEAEVAARVNVGDTATLLRS